MCKVGSLLLLAVGVALQHVSRQEVCTSRAVCCGVNDMPVMVVERTRVAVCISGKPVPGAEVMLSTLFFCCLAGWQCVDAAACPHKGVLSGFRVLLTGVSVGALHTSQSMARAFQGCCCMLCLGFLSGYHTSKRVGAPWGDILYPGAGHPPTAAYVRACCIFITTTTTDLCA